MPIAHHTFTINFGHAAYTTPYEVGWNERVRCATWNSCQFSFLLISFTGVDGIVKDREHWLCWFLSFHKDTQPHSSHMHEQWTSNALSCLDWMSIVIVSSHRVYTYTQNFFSSTDFICKSIILLANWTFHCLWSLAVGRRYRVCGVSILLVAHAHGRKIEGNKRTTFSFHESFEVSRWCDGEWWRRWHWCGQD